MSDGSDRTTQRAILGVIALLAAYNALVNEVLPEAVHGVAAACTGLLLWRVGRRAGLSADAVGVGRDGVRAGVGWGLATAAAVVVAIAVIGTLPATQSNFEDASVGALELPSVLWEVAIRIPTVTAGFEEFAFRGVLFALLVLVMPVRRAAIVQAALFGLWHVLPTHGPGSTWADVALAVGFTSVAGIVFAALRWRSGSVIAPLLLHTATNGATLVTAWLVT